MPRIILFLPGRSIMKCQVWAVGVTEIRKTGRMFIIKIIYWLQILRQVTVVLMAKEESF